MARGMREACLRSNISLPPELDSSGSVVRNEAVLGAAARLRMLDAADGVGPEQPSPAADSGSTNHILGNGHPAANGIGPHDNHTSSSSADAEVVRHSKAPVGAPCNGPENGLRLHGSAVI